MEVFIGASRASGESRPPSSQIDLARDLVTEVGALGGQDHTDLQRALAGKVALAHDALDLLL